MFPSINPVFFLGSTVSFLTFELITKKPLFFAEVAPEDRELAAAAGAIGGRALAGAFRLLCHLALFSFRWERRGVNRVL